MSGGTPPLGIEPRTCRLTADRSANGALRAVPRKKPLVNKITSKVSTVKGKRYPLH